MKIMAGLGVLLVSLNLSANGYEDVPMEVLEAREVLNLPVEEPFTLGHYIVNRDNWYKKFVKPKARSDKDYQDSNLEVFDYYTQHGEGQLGPIEVIVQGKNRHGNLYVIYKYGDVAMRILVKYDGDFIGFDYSNVECKYSNGEKFKFYPGILTSAREAILNEGKDILPIGNEEYTF